MFKSLLQFYSSFWAFLVACVCFNSRCSVGVRFSIDVRHMFGEVSASVDCRCTSRWTFSNAQSDKAEYLLSGSASTHYGVPWYFDWSCDWICVGFSFDFALDFSLVFSLEYSLEFKCSVVGCWIFIGCSLDIRWILENFPRSHHRVTLNICYICCNLHISVLNLQFSNVASDFL